MNILLIVLIIVLLSGGGYGLHAGWYGSPLGGVFGGGLGLVLLIVIILWIAGYL